MLEHISSGLSMPAIPLFEGIESKHNVYRGEDSMKKFYKFLRGYAMEIIDLKRKKCSYWQMNCKNLIKIQKCGISVKKNEEKHAKHKSIVNLWTIVIIQANVEVIQKEYVI